MHVCLVISIDTLRLQSCMNRRNPIIHQPQKTHKSHHSLHAPCSRLTFDFDVLHDESGEDEVETNAAVNEKAAAKSVRFDQIFHKNRDEEIRTRHTDTIGHLKGKGKQRAEGNDRYINQQSIITKSITHSMTQSMTSSLRASRTKIND